MESAVQIALPLFGPPSFGELLSAGNLTDSLMVTYTRRLKRSCRMRIDPDGKTHQLRIPEYMADAPAVIKQALIDWALLPCRHVRREQYRRKKQLERIIGKYIQTRLDVAPKQSRFNPVHLAAQTQGRIYDLQEVFGSVNAACFNGSLSAFLRWGPPRSRTSCHTVKIDPAGNRVNLITIAGLYDLPDVPRFAIETIMHHEMLHIAIPPVRENGRRVVHGASFKVAEKSFAHYKKWRAWERTGLPQLLHRK